MLSPKHKALTWVPRAPAPHPRTWIRPFYCLIPPKPGSWSSKPPNSLVLRDSTPSLCHDGVGRHHRASGSKVNWQERSVLPVLDGKTDARGPWRGGPAERIRSRGGWCWRRQDRGQRFAWWGRGLPARAFPPLAAHSLPAEMGVPWGLQERPQ